MICPHCKKEIVLKRSGVISRKRIITVLENTDHPLKQKELQKLSGLTKTNLKHHLDKLAKRKEIWVDKRQEERGRPALVSIYKPFGRFTAFKCFNNQKMKGGYTR